MFKKISSLFVLLILIGSTSCSAISPTKSFSSYFPQGNTAFPWTPTGDFQTYNQQTLFNYVDGQADSFLAYNFIQVGVQRYQDSQGNVITVEIWQLATDADAYGVFTISRAGTPINIGNEGDGDPGLRIIFWQDQFFVQIHSNESMPEDALLTLAMAVSANLPQGGSQPGLVKQLPPPGLDTSRVIYFHQETSIQSQVWLGGTNIMGLGPVTNGVLGPYLINGQSVYLLLIEYPTSDKATIGSKALQAAGIDNFVTCSQLDKLVGAVFGTIDLNSATELVKQALGG